MFYPQINFKKLSFLIVIYFIINSCNVSKNNFDNSICWEIRNPRNDKVSYILGTIHTLDTTQISFPINEFKNLIDKCENLCLEGVPTDSIFMRIVTEMYITSKDSILSKQLDENYYKRLIQIADSTNFLLNHYRSEIDFIKPNVLHVFLQGDKELIQSEKLITINYFPERDFYDYAMRKEYEIIPIEEWTFEEGKNVFWGFGLTYNESMINLKKAIENFDSKEKKIDLIKRYSEQNLKLGLPELFKDPVMIQRNIQMAKKMDSLMNIKKIFVAVGAAHLPYENGILSLLSNMGYSLKPYKTNLIKE